MWQIESRNVDFYGINDFSTKISNLFLFKGFTIGNAFPIGHSVFFP